MAHFVVTIVGSTLLPHPEQVEVHYVDTVAQLTPESDAVVLSSLDPAVVEQQLFAIRRTPVIAFLPVYVCERPHDLADGVWGEGGLLQTCEEMHLRRQALASVERMDEMIALLHYLWMRPGMQVRPARDWKSRFIYRYPLLEAFSDSEESARVLLSRLRAGQMLINKELIDRVPSCPQCQSGHLVFRETCVACHSINIIQSRTVHCFVCGHVGLENMFHRAGEMVCPHCSQTLRHIGSDYDRPIENLVCRDCGEMFVEPDSQAQCAECGRISAPEQIQIEDFSVWHLSEEGRQICYHGYSRQLGKVFDALDLIRPEYFDFSLRWLLNYSRRYDDSPFTLIMLDIKNLDELIRRCSMGQAFALLNAFVEHLSRLIRSTDFLMRSSETRLWLALPRTPQKGAQAFLEKVNSWIKKQAQDVNSQLNVEVYSYSSDLPEEFYEPEFLMAHLVNQMQESNT